MLHLLKRVMMAILLAAGGLARGQDAGSTSVPLDQVKQQVEARKAILVDVREKREWDRGHLRNAVLVPLSQLMSWDQNGISSADQAALRKALPRGLVVYCHCAAGGRAIPGSETLRKLGYDARPLREGYNALLAAGFAPAR